MQKQRGMTFIGLVLIIACVVFVAVIGMKLVPAYLEYFAVKKAILKIGNEPNFKDMTQKEIAESFTKSAIIDNIREVAGSDLVVSQDDSGKPVVSVDYQQVVPLIGNVSALLDFSVTTAPAKLSLK
ncbi:DUF4845 domain-containing protein [Methylovorus sp. MM2]|uniref:DUF4845 domain-containing protein n=1 Tax=Methylovorus sp. MM2 TaxID=1848038 RepID=UPI0007DF7542|nr:DUF4845 domain-containing protein [Methylovorus sp. MM2]OAM52581.1 DUF4845 domain-containing protein [Methylovorus sp. MM2]